MFEKPKFSPGCFGSPYAWKEDEVCKNCAFFAKCGEVSAVAREALDKMLGVDRKDKKRRDPNQIGSKARKVLEETGLSVDQIRSALMNGRNPFGVTKGFMGVVTHVLMNAREPTETLVAQLIIKHRSVSEQTAKTYVNIAAQILRHCEVLEKDKFSLVKG